MKKINLRGLNEVLSEKELKNVMGGSGGNSGYCYKIECTGVDETCNNTHDACIAIFGYLCSAGGFFYACGT